MLRDPSTTEQEHTADPAGWPSWTDDDRWEIPADVLDRMERIEEEEPFEPVAADRAWWAMNGPGFDQAEAGGAVFPMALAELLAAGRVD